MPHRSIRGRLSTLGQRFEQSNVGEAVISALVTVFVLVGVAWNLPNSPIQTSLRSTLLPIAEASGLQQNWSMYAPEPVSAVGTLEVRVTMSDKSERTWAWHRGDRVVGPFTWYHWQKLTEQVVRQPNSRPGLAHWVVRELTTPAERPVRVQLILFNQPLSPPGQNRTNAVVVKTLYDRELNGRP